MAEPWLEEPSAFTPEDARALAERWSTIHDDFIESPRAAIERADALLDEVIQRLVQALSEDRASLRLTLLDDIAPPTEELRMVLRRYRYLFNRLLAL